jgi:hypothetical protein
MTIWTTSYGSKRQRATTEGETVHPVRARAEGTTCIEGLQLIPAAPLAKDYEWGNDTGTSGRRV